jgi:hypothetical protein
MVQGELWDPAGKRHTKKKPMHGMRIIGLIKIVEEYSSGY